MMHNDDVIDLTDTNDAESVGDKRKRREIPEELMEQAIKLRNLSHETQFLNSMIFNDVGAPVIAV